MSALKLAPILLLMSIFAYPQQLNFRGFSFEQGLNTYNIQKTIQDKYGFIWVATQDGLYRYSGTNFEAFRKSTNTVANLQENFIMDIYYSGGDTIYAATFNGGIDAIDIRTLSVDHQVNNDSDPGNELPNLWIKKVYVDGHRNLWIGGKNYLSIYNIKSKTFKHINKLSGLENVVNVAFIHPVDENTVSVGVADYGILLFDINNMQIVAEITNLLAEPKRESNINDMFQTTSGVFLSTNSGIIKGKFINNKWVFEDFFQPEDLKGCIINCITASRNGELWIATNRGLGRLNLITGTDTLLSSEMNKSRWLIDNTIRHVMVDNRNNLWISTSKVLQFVNLNPNPFTHYTGTHPGSSKMDHIYSLVSISETEIFACGTDGLYIINLESGDVRRVKGTELLGTIHYLMKIDSSLWLVSTDQGMFPYYRSKGLLTQDHLLQLYPEWKPFVRNCFNTAVKISHATYWANEGQEGLLIWKPNTHTIKMHKAIGVDSRNFPENHIHNIKQDREGNLWLMFDNSVAKYDVIRDSVVQIIPYKPGSKTFNSGIFFDAFDSDTHVWFATFSGGLNGFNKGNGSWKYITEKEGLCNNAVYGILPEKDSVFWVSTNMGISRVNYVTSKCNNYFFEDGLQDNSFDEMGVLAMGNRLFFAGINGFTMLDLSNYKVNPEFFPVYIHRVEYYTRGKKKVLNQLSWNKLSLPSHTSSIIIHLSAISFSNNKKVNFSYRINDYENDYIPVAEDNKITLNAMNTGDYEIKIRYMNEAGDFVTDALGLKFYISPTWYQTWWFKMLLILLGLGLTYGVYKYRINQVIKEQKMRRSIASDLHDDIGGTLSSAKMLAHLAVSSPHDKSKLKLIEWNLEQATSNLKDLLWVLDDSLDTISDLIERLRRYAQPLAQAVNVTLDFASDDLSRNFPLSKAEKKNLFLIAKEAINNSLKYANCGKIYIRFSLIKKKLSVQIEDDGIGFSLEGAKEGYGLKNMAERAKQINFIASIQSANSSGTRIFLKQV